MDECIIFSTSELTECQRSAIDETAARLESLWTMSPFPDLRPLVPAPSHQLRRRTLVELIKVDQELQWEAGKQKYLESYLAEWPELEHHSILKAELLQAECTTRGYLGDLPTAEELRQRFQELSEQVDLGRIGAAIDHTAAP
jgi:hypothetical protein